DQKSVVEGKRGELGGRRIIKKKTEEDLSGLVARSHKATSQARVETESTGRARARADAGVRERSGKGVKPCARPISSRRRHTRFKCDWSSDVCSSDLASHTHTHPTHPTPHTHTHTHTHT